MRIFIDESHVKQAKEYRFWELQFSKLLRTKVITNVIHLLS